MSRLQNNSGIWADCIFLFNIGRGSTEFCLAQAGEKRQPPRSQLRSNNGGSGAQPGISIPIARLGTAFIDDVTIIFPMWD
jgi:hypothetical protein